MKALKRIPKLVKNKIIKTCFKNNKIIIIVKK